MADSPVGTYGTGTFEGTFLPLSLESEVVARLLDPALDPDPAEATPEGRHPVYFQLGRQFDVRGSWPVFRRLPIAYQEALVLVPWVRFKGGTRSFVFMPRLHLDSRWPTFLGRVVFGFAKTHTDVFEESPFYRVGDRQGPPRWTVTVTSTPDASAVAEAAVAKVLEVFRQPLLGVRELLGRRTELASWMTFRPTVARAVDVQLDLEDPFLAGCGLGKLYPLPGNGNGLPGSTVRLEARWTLTFPTSTFDR